MSLTRISELTPEQEALLSIIRDEWVKIALDTSPTDKQKAEEAIYLAYVYSGFKPPRQILWFDHPLAAVNWIVGNRYIYKLQDEFSQDLSDFTFCFNLEKTIVYFTIERSIEITVRKFLGSELGHLSRLGSDILDSVCDGVDRELFKEKCNFIESIYTFHNGLYQLENMAFYAYLQAVGVDCSQMKGRWEAAKHCGFWWAFKDIAIATPKSSVIHLDNEGRLHAEGEPAVSYKGFNIYAYHGVRLPEKYGQLQPNAWQPQWFLEEDNAELRRVLIQGIGYTRICQELQAVELDSWREYVLLGVEESIDVEPIYLLKMICPSTGYVHVLRVPPNVNSAREAILWVNWGVDPEEFAVQT